MQGICSNLTDFSYGEIEKEYSLRFHSREPVPSKQREAGDSLDSPASAATLYTTVINPASGVVDQNTTS